MDSNRRYPKDDDKLFIGDGILAVLGSLHDLFKTAR
jgi:hypothetical protein